MRMVPCAAGNADAKLIASILLTQSDFALLNAGCDGGMRIGTTQRQRLRELRYARIVKKHFAVMLVHIGSIAATRAILRIGSGKGLLMTNEQFERERRYRVAISVAVRMLKQSLITEDEYQIINEMMIEKYNPFFGGLIR